MIEQWSQTALALVPVWGGWLIMAVTFLSCLALPMPASLVMLAGGAFTASGDLSLAAVAGAALVGAVAGDQTGYLLARTGGSRAWDRLAIRPGAAAMLTRAVADLARRDLVAIFLSRWLFSPLGPYVNFAAGMTRLDWRRFTLAGIAGEAVWVGVYVGLGYAFAAQIGEIGAAMANLGGGLAAAAVALVLGRMLWRMAHEEHDDDAPETAAEPVRDARVGETEMGETLPE